MGGPLTGRRVVELAGIGPGPYAGMLLADMGADVICVERPGGSTLPSAPPGDDLFNRGKRSVVVDLKRAEGVAAVLELLSTADVLIEGNRPGAAERLGLGPDAVWARRRSLVYGRMTGWGQDGPLATAAGHDISYIAVTGALHAMGDHGGPPQIPLNLVGDFAGGSCFLVMGVLAALLEADRTGRGQVVDAAIVDGTAHLLTLMHTMMGAGAWQDRRGSNTLDGGAPFYSVYATADARHMAVGALEPRFFAELLHVLGIGPDEVDPARQNDRSTWPAMRASLAAAFSRRSRDEWTALFAGTDACVSPVLSLSEAPAHSHVAARGSVVEDGSRLRAGPAPRFSDHEGPQGRPPELGEHTREVLADCGIDVDGLLATGAIVQADQSLPSTT